jgi:alkylated DNA repair dioxygenase AlkB
MAKINYKLIKNFFPKEELDIFQKYCYNQIDNYKSYEIDPQSFSPSWYNDPLMTSLLYTKLSLVEKESNLKLFQTYAYWRYYIFGATLSKHTDRPACEISVSACIKKYDNWPIIVEGTSFELEEGDAVLYNGCDQEHWRPGVYKGEGMAQVFLHYVNQNGIYKNHAFDKIN